MENSHELSLATIVNKFPSAAGLFDKFDLDYCCRGKQTLREACKEDEIKFNRIAHALHRIAEDELANNDHHNFETEDLGVLINYIVNKHHKYLKETMPVILAHLEKVSTKHGQKNPELNEIYQLFDELKMDMEHHMYKEEHILFPRIKEVNNSLKSVALSRSVDRRFLNAPISVMEDDHEKAGNILHEIRKLSADYSPPPDACTTYRISYEELKQLEHDLHKHVHLENNILFPRAVEAQTRLGEQLSME